MFAARKQKQTSSPFKVIFAQIENDTSLHHSKTIVFVFAKIQKFFALSIAKRYFFVLSIKFYVFSQAEARIQTK